MQMQYAVPNTFRSAIRLCSGGSVEKSGLSALFNSNSWFLSINLKSSSIDIFIA